MELNRYGRCNGSIHFFQHWSGPIGDRDDLENRSTRRGGRHVLQGRPGPPKQIVKVLQTWVS